MKGKIQEKKPSLMGTVIPKCLAHGLVSKQISKPVSGPWKGKLYLKNNKPHIHPVQISMCTMKRLRADSRKENTMVKEDVLFRRFALKEGPLLSFRFLSDSFRSTSENLLLKVLRYLNIRTM